LSNFGFHRKNTEHKMSKSNKIKQVSYLFQLLNNGDTFKIQDVVCNVQEFYQLYEELRKLKEPLNYINKWQQASSFLEVDISVKWYEEDFRVFFTSSSRLLSEEQIKFKIKEEQNLMHQKNIFQRLFGKPHRHNQETVAVNRYNTEWLC
jgi:hypothetical protein